MIAVRPGGSRSSSSSAFALITAALSWWQVVDARQLAARPDNPEVRKMMILSFAFHIVVFVMGSAMSPLFPTMRFSPPVIVELTDAPVSELPEELPAPPPPIALSARPESLRPSPNSPVSTRPAPKQPPAARRWLDKLDAGMTNVPEAPVTRREGKAGGSRCAIGRMRVPQRQGISPPPSPPKILQPSGSTWESWRPVFAGPADPAWGSGRRLRRR